MLTRIILPATKPPVNRALSVRLHSWIKKGHAYIGLLNLSIVLVWGVTGIYAMLAHNEEGSEPATSERTIPYRPPKEAPDQEIAKDIFDLVKPPLAGPLPVMSLEHDAHKNMLVKFYRPGVILDATVLEEQGLIRVEEHVGSLLRYVSDMHQVTIQPGQFAPILQLWSYYTELSIWSLLALVISGVLMWLLSRPRYRPAQLCFYAGVTLFFFLWLIVR